MKNPEKKLIVLLDAHAIIHRAYHGMPDFTNSRGEPTGALYGICSMLFRIIETLHPYHIIACYDLPEKTFRHEAYSAYKGTRRETDTALVEQIIKSREIFDAFNIPMLDSPGFEADDILGTLVHQVLEQHRSDYRIIIASGDMDTMQLISADDVQVFTLKKSLNDTVLYNEQAVIDRYGFGPKLIPDYKGLRGDASDNIPGIPGIGEKTGTDLIVNFGSIESLYETLEKNPEKLAEAGIKPRIVNLLTEHRDSAEFSKILATIRTDAPVDFAVPEVSFLESIHIDSIKKFLTDCEFKSLIPRFTSLVANLHNHTENVPDIYVEQNQQIIAPDKAIINELGIMLWVWQSQYTNADWETITSVTGKSDPDEIRIYLIKQLQESQLWDIYQNIEQPLIAILAEMKKTGVYIDTTILAKLSIDYHRRLDILETEIYEMTGDRFNINSPKQVSTVLFEKMMLASDDKKIKIKKNKSGGYSTRESELEKLRGLHPVIDKLLAYRELQKLLSTYIDTLPTYADEHSRIHGDFIQHGSSTGRFASTNPNLQNIPIRGTDGARLRDAFVAPKNKKLLIVDYSQIELRVVAIMSGDTTLIDIFKNGIDIHSGVASEMFGVPIDAVTGDMRRKAKTINFGILYGMGVTALGVSLGIPRSEAITYHDAYFAQFPKVRDYMEQTVVFAKKHGYTETMFGRRRMFGEITSGMPHIIAMAERAAANAPVQGSAADIIKLAMIATYNRIKSENLSEQVAMVMQIHDELVFEIDPSVADRASEIIRDEMEQVLTRAFKPIITDVPMSVSLTISDSWGEK